MGFIEMCQLVTTHLQFLALLNQLTIPWPATWRRILSWVEIFNLDFHDILVQHDFPRFDFRAVFLVVAVVVPITIVMLVLIIFNPFYVVLWYACFVGGLIVLIVGILGYYLPAATGIASERNVAMSYMILGGTIVGCLLIVAAIHHVRKKRQTAASAGLTLKENALRCSKTRSLKHLFFAVFCFVAGAILYGIIDISVGGGEH